MTRNIILSEGFDHFLAVLCIILPNLTCVEKDLFQLLCEFVAGAQWGKKVFDLGRRGVRGYGHCGGIGFWGVGG